MLALFLLLPLILLGAILAHRSRSKAWKGMVAPRLRKQLVRESSLTRRWLSLALAMLGAALIIVVLARPFIGKTTTTEQIRTRNILIAIDTSRSMLVRDGSPDRMASAQATALELLEAFPNDRVGVIAFSGAPVLMVPLTIDHAAVQETISQLDTEVIPTGGSDLNAAVQLALETFEQNAQKADALIIISDGENHSQETENTATDIRASGVTICSISVGTTTGGIIPDPQQRSGKFLDIRGQTVLSRMIPDALDTLSRAGRGTYIPASRSAVAEVRATLSSVKRHREMGRKRTIPSERYQWFLLPAILLLTLSLLVRSQLFSKKTTPTQKTKIKTKTTTKVATTSLILTFSLLLPHPLHAATIDRAESAYERKDYSSALTLFKVALKDASGEDQRAIEFAMGSSAYRLHQWSVATTHFSSALLTNNKDLQENTHYNLGKSLFRSGLSLAQPQQSTESIFLNILTRLTGQFNLEDTPPLSDEDFKAIVVSWQDSIDHYQATLDLNPDNQRASNNQKKVKRLLDELKRSQQKKDQEEDQKKDPDDQGHHPETDPNNDPEQQEGEDSKDKGEGDDPDKNSDNKGEGDKKDPNKDNQKDKDNNSDNNNDGESEKPQNKPKDKPDMKRQNGETDEAYAERILKENSDAETRPVQRPHIRLRRPAKDW